MSKKTKILLIVMFFIAVALIGIFVANAEEAEIINKCCINPNTDPTNICRTDVNILENECCPADGDYSGANNGPTSQTDCKNNFFSSGSACVFVSECSLIGCCCPEGVLYYKEPQCRPSSEPNDRFITYGDYKSKTSQPVSENVFYTSEFCANTVCKTIYQPPVVGECKTPNPIIATNPDLTGPVRGEKTIKLTWNDKCKQLAEQGKLQYKVERCEGTDCNDNDFAEIGIPTELTSVYDRSVEWEKTYTYKIIAVDNFGNRYPSNPVSIFTGNVECWNVKDEAPFCIHASYYQKEPIKNYPGLFLQQNQLQPRYTAKWNKAFKCHVDNKINVLSKILECRGDSVCVIANNQPDCYSKSACKEPEKPLGLYDKKASCEAPRSYCFYDKSATIVDSCYPCKEDMSCYDYKSQQACIKDNCGIKNCEWRYTYSELGIGACVDKTKSNCANCEQKGTEGMENIPAYNEVFDSCSGNLRQTRIAALSTTNAPCVGIGVAPDCAEVTCRSYDTDVSCNENDQCNIKVCYWFGDPNKGGYGCRKDADRVINESPDCALGNEGLNCEKDYFAPETTITSVYELGSISRFNINIQDKKAYRESYAPIADSEKQSHITYLCGYVDKTLNAGDKTTVKIGSKNMLIEIITITTAPTTDALIKVNGKSASVAKGNTYTFDGITIYIQDILYYTQPIPGHAIRLFIGAAGSCNLPFKFSIKNSEVAERATLSTFVNNKIISLDQQNVIKYYSVDPNKNIEQTKELSLSIPTPKTGLVIYITKPEYWITSSPSIEVAGTIFSSSDIAELKIMVAGSLGYLYEESLPPSKTFSKIVNLDTTEEQTLNVIAITAKNADNIATSSFILIIYDKKAPKGKITFE